MTNEEKQRSNSRARILKAMAHPSRMFIIEKLTIKPHCVCELAEMIGSSQPTVSNHLSILKNSGIIEDKKKRTTVYYSLRCNCINEFINCVESVIRMNIEQDLSIYRKDKVNI